MRLRDLAAHSDALQEEFRRRARAEAEAESAGALALRDSELASLRTEVAQVRRLFLYLT